MIKRTLYFGNPFYLSTQNEQLIIQSKTDKKILHKSTPIEDIGFLVIDHPQITISHVAVQKLTDNNVAVVYCDHKRMPFALLLPLESHHIQSERFRKQIEVKVPVKKILWKQTIERKILNQATLLHAHGHEVAPLIRWSKEVKSGDTTNREALASRYYWQHLFRSYIEFFTRERTGVSPNNMLNYGYAILRAATARALCGVGLLPVLGIHHRNKYNAYCLADDIMEPYRPFVDEIVLDLVMQKSTLLEELDKYHKQQLLQITFVDTCIDNQISPLMIALQKTASSLVKCYEGSTKTIKYPSFPK